MNHLLMPDFAIIGAQKSASTFIQDALAGHPDIHIPKKEVRFFEDPEYGNGNLVQVSALFDAHPGKIKGIKRPDYLGRAEVPARIKAAAPDIKLIVVLRNPVDRFVSAYYYYVKLGFLPAMDINAAIPIILRGEFQGSPKRLDLLGYGNYATHLKRYFSVFSEKQFLLLRQEDIAAAAETVLNTACDFIGAKVGILRQHPRKANIGTYPLKRLRFLSRRNKYLYDYDEITGKLIEKKLTPMTYLAAGAITAVDRLVLARVIGNDKPVLKNETREMLCDYYRREVIETQRLAGLDLRAWIPQ